MKTLVEVFNNKCQQFFEDLDQIQVISKRDPNEDSEQLCRLAQQIFLLDGQRNSLEKIGQKCRFNDPNNSTASGILSIGENRSFIFLINNGDRDPLT